MNKEKLTLNFYTLIWIFTIGCVFGFLVEFFWFIVKWGYVQYNQGFLYGPLQPVYGFGALLLTLLCYYLKTNKKWLIFILGFIAFGIFEHFSGWIMEYFLGAFSWDYNRVGFHLTIGKYVYLPYCFIWGLFALVWHTLINDKLLKFFSKFKSKTYKYITIVLGIFLVFNFSLTQLAIARKIEREKSIPANDKIRIFFDKYYDDEYFAHYMPKVRLPKS